MDDWKDKLASLAQGMPSVEEDSEDPQEDRKVEKSCQNDMLHVVVDRKGRKGKTATIIEGFTLSDEEVEELASELKQKIGVGGSARCGEILLQGECRDKVMNLLKTKGFKVK